MPHQISLGIESVPWENPFYYFAFGAACSEVTVDTTTGEHIVERVDIIHDVGLSLNPAIDHWAD